jgi:hypothetical protein
LPAFTGAFDLTPYPIFTGLIKGREREQGIKTKMRVKVTTKMLVIAWTLLKKGEKFQPEYLLK